jgi:hypothetical protein
MAQTKKIPKLLLKNCENYGPNKIKSLAQYKKEYGFSSFDIKSKQFESIPLYNDFIDKHLSPDALEIQGYVVRLAINFDQIFCEGKLMQQGKIKFVLPNDSNYVRALPDDHFAITYEMTIDDVKSFSIYILYSLCEPPNVSRLIDTVLHELVHAKIHCEAIGDLADHEPNFLYLCSKVANYYGLVMQLSELQFSLDGGEDDS